jgi:transposase
MAKKIWAGLDVGVETTSVCIIDDQGEVLHEAVCPTVLKSVHAEIRPLRRRRFARVALEAGTGVNLARGLRTLGYSVDIYESRQLSKFLRVRCNKTDAGDASGIAEAGRVGASAVSKVYLKNLDCQALQSRLAIRRHLIRERVAAVNLLCRQLEVYGGRVQGSSRARRLRETVEAELKQLFGKESSPLVAELRLLLDRCEDMVFHQRALDDELERLALDNEVCRRFMAIPGIGPICALTFYAAVGEPGRFARSANIGAYFGLAPTIHQSGLTNRRGRISRMGSAAMRSLLVQAGMTFMRLSSADSDLRAWACDIETRRGAARARVALARKLAIVMLSMWKTGETYRPRRASV